MSDLAVGGAVLGIVVAGFVAAIGQVVQTYLHAVLQRKLRLTVEARLFRAIHAVTGLSSFEDPARLDRIRLAEQAGESAPDGVLGSGLTGLQSAVTGAGFVITILVLCPWVVLVVLAAAVPTALLQLRLGRLRTEVLLDTSVYHRRLIFYRYLATDARAAKEVRLFGLGDFLIGRMLRDLGSANAAEAAVDRAAARIGVSIAALSGLVTITGASAAAVLAWHHRLSIGEVTVLLAAVIALQALVGQVTESASHGYRSLLLFGHYLAIEADAASVAAGEPVPPLQSGIEFDDVWFRYGPDQPWVLQGLDVVLPAGTSIGLVGLNGAGKTTLVKLLCRFYEPERGSIRWDGQDLRTLDPAQLRARIGAVFQDFMAYDFSAGDNIAIGALDALGQADRIEAAARRAGVHDIITNLPAGYATMLSRIFPPDEHAGQAAELSGGQWQRIALARAFLRADADVLILDEPSSGLDAQVEQELNRTLGAIRAGRLSLLISHRMSALKSADLIVVLDNGRISELGTPAELTQAGGTFATLFALQAEGYRLPVTAADRA